MLRAIMLTTVSEDLIRMATPLRSGDIITDFAGCRLLLNQMPV